MYFISSYNKILEVPNGKRLYNTITKKSIGYSILFDDITDKLNNQQIEYKADNLEETILQIIVAECVFRGLLIPIEQINSERQYLEDLTLFTRGKIGFFNCSFIDCNSLNNEEGTKIGFLGIASDAGAARPGSRYGPEIIRERSTTLNFRGIPENHLINLKAKRNVFENGNIFELGNINLTSQDHELCLKKVNLAVQALGTNIIPIIIGGDHSFSLAIIEALYSKRNAPFSIIQFDSHLDVQIWGEFNPNNSRPHKLDQPSHSNFISWVKEKVPEVEILQVGISAYQSISNKLQEKLIIDYLGFIGTQITDIEFLTNQGFSFVNEKFPSNQDVYITIDVDVLNSCIMTETGFPSSTGITFAQLYSTVISICEDNNVIGVDIMEFGTSHKREQHYDMATRLCFLILAVIEKINQKIGARKEII
jgi:arginase family enzyme